VRDADAVAAKYIKRTIAVAGALRELTALIPHRRFPADGNAPGHVHAVAGIWDNGARAGESCDWCAAWKSAHDTLAAAGDQ